MGQEVRRVGRSDELERDVVRESHQPAEGALRAPSSFGDSLVTRCSRESQHSAESWAPRPLVEHQENKNDTQLCPEGLVRSICCSLCSVSNSLSQANLKIKWEVSFFREVFPRLYYCVIMILSAWICIWVYNIFPKNILMLMHEW